MSRDTGFFQAMFNAVTGTGCTIHHTKDIWGHPKTTVKDYDRGCRTERVHHKGFFGNRDTYERRDLNGDWRGDFSGRTGIFSGHHSGDYEGVCFACNGTGVFRNGQPCRRCGGTGVWHKHHD